VGNTDGDGVGHQDWQWPHEWRQQWKREGTKWLATKATGIWKGTSHHGQRKHGNDHRTPAVASTEMMMPISDWARTITMVAKKMKNRFYGENPPKESGHRDQAQATYSHRPHARNG
jgi:hypothetical protein